MKKFNKHSSTVISLILSVLIISAGFTGPTSTEAAGPATINLLSAGNFTILSKTAVTTTGATTIVGDIGVSPALSTDTSGFALILDGSGTFSTSALVVGKVYAADYAVPTPATMSTAISDMEAAYTDAATRTPGTGATNLNLDGGILNGNTLVPGTFTWGSNVTITGDITFSGAINDVWVLQISGNLDIQAGKKILLSGGAQAKNIFWQVAGTTTLLPGSTFEGIILAGPGASTIAMQSGAILHGKALGQTDVTLIGNTIFTPTTTEQICSTTTLVSGTNTQFKHLTLTDPSGSSTDSLFTLGTSGVAVLTVPDGFPGAWDTAASDPDVAGAIWVNNNATAPSTPSGIGDGQDGNVDTWRLFSDSFTIPADAIVSSATLHFTSDNSVQAFLDNTSVGAATSYLIVNDVALSTTTGTHELEFVVKNDAYNGATNPTGLLYKMVIDYCTPTPLAKGHLIVEKTTDPSGDPTVFNITASGDGIITGGGVGTVTDVMDKDYEVTEGIYSVTEFAIAGWNTTSNTCNAVVVLAGATLHCLITNTKQASSSISGMKYNDLNRNGKLDVGEPGLAGWVIKLKLGDVLVATTTTDVSGHYSFNNLAPGKYKVRETHKKGWKRISKNPKPIIIISGSIVTDVNFGNAMKRKGEKEDTDKDCNRDEQFGDYHGAHGRSSYENNQGR